MGPTSSGKSSLAVRLAKRFNGEIISADSRQVYRGMDIGTGKITKKEMAGVPHYLLDAASPHRRFSAAQFKKLGEKAVKIIQSKGKLPIICGGTGFYIQALVDDLKLPEVKPDFKLRARLERMEASKLYQQLKKLDPQRAKNIDPRNKRRLVRAIEIVKKTGRPVPKINPPAPSFKRRDGGLHILFLGIKKSNEELQKNIAKRLDRRIKAGMIKEVEKLRQSGLSWKRLEEFGLEYRWVAKFLQGKINRQEMLGRLQKEIEHFAKRQLTWFRRDKRIHWVTSPQEAIRLISRH